MWDKDQEHAWSLSILKKEYYSNNRKNDTKVSKLRISVVNLDYL